MKKLCWQWGMTISLVLLLFALGILLIGYKPLTIGNASTIVVLAISAAVCGRQRKRCS